jgi:NAD(P)H-hydrate epimerase
MEIATAQQMQELDRKTIQDIGIPGVVLMENAGRGTVYYIRKNFPDLPKKTVLVLAGRGNNGGDGFVIARYLLNASIDVKVLLLCPLENVTGDAAINAEAYRHMGGALQEIPDRAAWQGASDQLKSADLVIDAILGTGLSSEVKGLFRKVIEDLNESTIPIVSVDLPSGIHADSGAVMGVAVRARLTCTFGLPKRGLLLFPGASCVGDLEIVDIGIPRTLIQTSGLKEFLLEESDIKGKFPGRDSDSHKGNYGHLFILAASPGKTGAAAMAAQAAMRVGAGLVTLGVPASLNPILEAKVTEVMTEPLPDSDTGLLGMDAWPTIKQLLPGKNVIAIGPGLSAKEKTVSLVQNILEQATVPLVIDADGLNAIAKAPDVLKKTRAPVVLTPHPGEMARLMGTTSKEIQRYRIEHARGFATTYDVIVILKGARTVIAEPDGTIYINPTGNPYMASGGMGDVLTGMIAGLLAQNFDPLFASQFSVYLHGLIADRIARARAKIGIMATDIILEIPKTFQEFL